jgi:hypothetical protein
MLYIVIKLDFTCLIEKTRGKFHFKLEKTWIMLNLINLPSCFLIRIILNKSDEVIINDFYLEK